MNYGYTNVYRLRWMKTGPVTLPAPLDTLHCRSSLVGLLLTPPSTRLRSSDMNSVHFLDKVIVITGGGSGFGRAGALACARDGGGAAPQFLSGFNGR